MAAKRVYEIDGANFSDLAGFFDEVSENVIPDFEWGRNLDAFNDILYGGFGTPDEGFILVWKNHELSKDRLGYEETIRSLERRLERCHPSWRSSTRARIRRAGKRRGPTLYDDLVAIICAEEHSDVELRLE